jgi:hypothetical protein
VLLWEQTQEKVRVEEALKQKKSLKKENQRPGFVGEIREVPLTVRSERSGEGLTHRP